MSIFQKILNKELASVAIYENELIYSFMDAFPQSLGHALIIPKQVAPDIFSLDEKYLSEISIFSKKLAQAQKKALQADGIKIMQLNGSAAGQTVFHYHLHLIPCWEGKKLENHGQNMTNFNELQEIAERIKSALII